MPITDITPEDRMIPDSIFFLLKTLVNDRNILLDGAATIEHMPPAVLPGGVVTYPPSTTEAINFIGYNAILSNVEPTHYDVAVVSLYTMINNINTDIDELLSIINDFSKNNILNQNITKENFANSYKKKYI